eukprot:gene4337-3151_t
MKITLAVELQDNEQHRAAHIKHIMEDLHPNVETRFITDKGALADRITEAMKSEKFDQTGSDAAIQQVLTEVEDRLKHPAFASDCLDTLCSVVFFSTQRIAEGHSSARFVNVVARLPDEQRDRMRADIVKRAMAVLSTPRRLDCSRMALLSYAETLASMVKADLLPVRNFVGAITQMIRLETTRTAGITCLGKLVEVAFDLLRTCDPQTIVALRGALTFAQQGDTFLYDMDYILDAFGWSLTKSPLKRDYAGSHHKSPILAMAYSPAGGNARETVLTSSVDGCIGTWDGNGVLLENIILARHYASSLDLANRGHTLLVGTVGRNHATPPAVISYTSEIVDSKWTESSAVEPINALYITAVRSLRSSPRSDGLRFCVATHTDLYNPLQIYDRQSMVMEYHDHTDIITALHVTADNDNTMLSGSRDSTVVLYDLRMRGKGTTTFTQHSNTVTAIGTCGDLLFTAGLDRRVVIQDFRMGGTMASREMDSAVLALSVSSSMQCAVSTLTGIHVISGSSNSILQSVRVDSGQLAPRYNALQWNSSGSRLYAGGDSCTLDVYVDRLPSFKSSSSIGLVKEPVKDGQRGEAHTVNENTGRIYFNLFEAISLVNGVFWFFFLLLLFTFYFYYHLLFVFVFFSPFLLFVLSDVSGLAPSRFVSSFFPLVLSHCIAHLDAWQTRTDLTLLLIL